MKAAIIGAAGFVGRALAHASLATGHDARGYDVAPDNQAGEFTCNRLDVLTDKIEFDPATECVFYLAQSPFYKASAGREDHLFGINTMGAIKAADAACRAGARFFCYASTGNVYQPSFEPMSESHPIRRDQPYILSKVMAEEALKPFRDRMSVVSARLFGVFGPGQGKMLPARICQMVRNGREIELTASPRETEPTEGIRISFSYVADVVDCLIRLAEKALDGANLPDAINVAGPEAISLRRFATAVGKGLGLEPVFRTAAEPRKSDLIADITRLRGLLNPDFTSFDEAVTTTVAAL